MRCASCGTESPPQAKFCFECAAPLARRCASCGTVLPEAARFCMECAHPVPSSSTMPDQATTPRAYTPRHLAEKILVGRDSLAGERKQVTVLFADVKGSTELIQSLDTESAQQLLDGAVGVMMDAVHRFEGTVSRAMGDGIMALFGAPIAHEDHAVRACYAALALQDGMRRYAEQARRTYGALVEARVGLNSGDVIVRLISDDLHMDYTAMGQMVHLASRLEQLASGGSIVLSPETLRLVEGYVQVRSEGPVPIRGLADPVDVFTLLGAGPARTRLQAAATRGLSRFVGRQAEMEALHGALTRAGNGHGQVAALVGEPGVGKSRLVWELIHSHRTQEWLILESSSVSYGKATSYLPVIDLLKSYCRVESRDDERTIREKVTGKLLTLDEGLRPALPALLALLDVPTGDDAWAALDPAQRRRQTLDAVRRLLLRESQEQPLLLVFEDLHWIDSESQALLDTLIESLPTARMVLLVNFRPEYSHTWGSKSYYTQLRIDPLSDESAEALLDGLLGNDPALDPLKALLVQRTEGNPFFLEESVRTLVETGELAGERGAYRMPRPLATVRMPATVQAVLAARIDRLPPEEKRLLQTASVVGKDVPETILRAIADTPEDVIYQGLAGLQAAEFLYQVTLFPESEYTFKHALTHEVAYGSLLQERKRLLHGRIVDAIERLYPDRLDEHVERLAHHALAGEQWERAAGYWHAAGQKGMARSAYREAVASFEQALVAHGHLPESREEIERAIDLRLELRSALFALAEHARVLEHLRVAESLAERLDDHPRLGLVASFVSISHALRGGLGESARAGDRAIDIATSLDDIGLLATASCHQGRVLLHLGRFAEAVDLLTRNIARLTGDAERQRFGMVGYPAVISRSLLTWVLAEQGRFAEGLAHGREAIRIAEEIGQPYSLGHATGNLGRLHTYQGNVAEAIRVLEYGLDTGRRWEVVPTIYGNALMLAHAYALAARPDDAMALIDEWFIGVSSGAASTAVGNSTFQALLLCGQVDRAVHLFGNAPELFRERSDRLNEARALRLVGELALRREPPDLVEAEAHYRASLARADQLGMRTLQAHCHLGLGKLCRRLGRFEEAQTELSQAAAMLREMGMALWLPEAESELAEAIAARSAAPTG